MFDSRMEGGLVQSTAPAKELRHVASRRRAYRGACGYVRTDSNGRSRSLTRRGTGKAHKPSRSLELAVFGVKDLSFGSERRHAGGAGFAVGKCVTSKAFQHAAQDSSQSRIPDSTEGTAGPLNQ